MAMALKKKEKNGRWGETESLRRSMGNTRRFKTEGKIPRFRVWPWIRGIFSLSGGIVLVIIFFGFLSVGLLFGYRYLTSGDFFSLRVVDIQGNMRLSEKDIMEQSGLALGRNTLEINLSEIRDRLMKNPWIQEVSLKRILPDGFSVFIKEKQPVYFIGEGETLFYADEQAAKITPVEATGFMPLPHLVLEGLEEEALFKLPAIMKDLSKSNVFKTQEASWIRVALVEGLEMYFSDAKLRIRLDNGSLAEQLARIDMVWAELSHRGETSDVRAIQSIGDLVWVEYSHKVWGAVPREKI